MRSPRFITVILKLKSQQKNRSLNLSYSPYTIWCSAHILNYRSLNEPIIFFGNLGQIPKTFMQIICSYSDIINDVLFSHQSNSQPPNQQFQILAYRMRHLSYIQALWFSDQNHALDFFLCIFVIFNFYFMLYFY